MSKSTNHDKLSFENYVDFFIYDTAFLRRFVDDNPYVKIIKFIHIYAMISIRKDKISEVLDYLAFNCTYVYPVVMGLTENVNGKTTSLKITKDDKKPYLGLTGKDTLIAFIDTGIDYTKDVFRNKDGATRIEYIWDQTQSENTPSELPYGTEYSRDQINAALQLENPLDLVPHQDTVGHGTFLASVAGGSDTNEYVGISPEAKFLIVKLRKANRYYLEHYAIPREIGNVFSSLDVLLALEYVVEKSIELGKPVSICLGVGTTIGGHDSYSVLEEYIHELSKKPLVCITVAGGNERLSKHHTKGKVESKAEKRIEVLVKEPIEGFLVTLLMGTSDRYTISIVLPSGELIGPVPLRSGTQFETISVTDNVRTLINYHFPGEGSGSQVTTIKFFQPSVGVIKIIIHPESIFEGIYQAWLPLSTLSPPGIEFVEYDEYQTIVIPGTSSSCITCGAYDKNTGELYQDSSWGPIRTSIIKPDLVAPGVDMVGVYPSGYGTMTGTGVAAAYTAGTCANVFQWSVITRYYSNMNTILIKSYLISSCIREADVIYPNEKLGYGKLSLENMFESIKSN